MKKTSLLSLLLVFLAGKAQVNTSVSSNAQYQVAYDKADAHLLFRYSDEGKPTPIEWGFDLAWLDEANLRRGIAFSGKEVVDMMRVSYMPSGELKDGKLTNDMLSHIKERTNLVKKYCKEGVGININDDHATVDSWYNPLVSSTRAERWAQVIDLTAQEYVSRGLNLVSISPFNEPDFGWDQGLNSSTRKQDFLSICKVLRESDPYAERYKDVRLCGGNTLNCDQAFPWWDFLKTGLDEGNTHQLAGDFDHYASFFESVRAYGHHATADELHNTMEAMVGVEYGMQTGIWWGTAEYARAQFMKATYQGNPGQRLGYVEHRPNWTSAAVYRQPEGNVQGFVGSSERQAATTTYQFTCTDRDVYFNGQGPMRHFVAEIPGGTGYQQGQTNAETVFDIQSGEDVQPYINGTYRIVNKYSNTSGKAKYLGYSDNPGTNWMQLQQSYKALSSSKVGFQQWVVTPVDSRIGGDYSYYDIRLAGNNEIRIDILNWSLDNGGKVGIFKGGLGNNEQWYLQYAGDGWFYIRSKHCALALACTSTAAGSANTVQQTFNPGDEKQMWRFIPADAEYDKEAPATPLALAATPLAAAVRLSWAPVEDEDLAGYDILRTEKGKDEWNTIARGLTDCTFTDNTAEDGTNYLYAVRATDMALNRSAQSESVESAVSGEKGLICRLTFDETLADISGNGNHAIMPAEPAYTNRATNVKEGTASLDAANFFQLPTTISHHDAITVACWVRRASSSAVNEHIFDFGNGTDQYIFLTPNTGSKMRLCLKDGSRTETLDVGTLTTGFRHVAVTIDGEKGEASIYVNGALKGNIQNLTIKPSQLQTVCNYVGRGQSAADPLLKGFLDDFRVYNYALTAEEVEGILAEPDAITSTTLPQGSTPRFTTVGIPADRNARGVIIGEGVKTLKR